MTQGNGAAGPDDLPNLGMLIKLLKLTTSSVDSEALLAMRKANEQLAKFGGDWERLLRGKVTIIANPFDTISAPATSPPPGDPTARYGAFASKPKPPPPPPPPQPKPQPAAPRYTPPPPPPPKPPPPPQFSTKRIPQRMVNKYSGNCVSCNKYVLASGGVVIRDLTGAWHVECQSCTDARTQAFKMQKRQRPTVDDLLKMVQP